MSLFLPLRVPLMHSKPLRILLLEDSPVDAELLLLRLDREGYKVDVTRAASRAEFTAALDDGPFDLIFGDYQLPDYDGLTALALATERHPETPFIFVSGVLGEDVAVDTLQRGATDYVLKTRLERVGPAVRRALQLTAERTERRAAQAALRTTEMRLQRIAENIRDYAIFALDLEGRIVNWNVGGRRLFGYDDADVIGRPLSVLFADDDRDEAARHALEEARADGRALHERWLRRRDGSRFFGSGVLSAATDEAGAVVGFTKLIRDETDRRRLTEEREHLLESERKARAEAEAANRAKDAFLAVLSHELRTPLSPILMTCHLLAGDTSVPAHAHESLEIIRRNAELEARLIDDLLDLTRISRGKIRLNVAATDLHSLIDSTIEICRPDILQKQLNVHVSKNAVVTLVDGDSARLQQVLWNLLKNAVKFTPQGGRITLTTTAGPGETIRVTIADTGIGIDPSAIKRIFSAFEQADVTIVRRFGGLGLGLAIAKTLAGMHGGSIHAHSAGIGQGAVFELQLPVKQPTAVAPAVGATPAAPEAGLRLLLVEDHLDTARMMEILLKRLGHRVDLAHDVAGATSLLQQGGYDLLISDIGLPDGSGLDVIRAMPKPAFPAIALTGFGMEHDVARCRAAGFSEHLTKPVQMNALSAAIRNLSATRVTL